MVFVITMVVMLLLVLILFSYCAWRADRIVKPVPAPPSPPINIIEQHVEHMTTRELLQIVDSRYEANVHILFRKEKQGTGLEMWMLSDCQDPELLRRLFGQLASGEIPIAAAKPGEEF